MEKNFTMRNMTKRKVIYAETDRYSITRILLEAFYFTDVGSIQLLLLII